MKLYLILYIVIGLIITSCQNNEVNRLILTDYEESLTSIDSILVNHFPKILPETYTFMTTLPKKDTLKVFGFACDKIMFWTNYAHNEFISLRKRYDARKKASYYSSDSSLLIIFSYCNSMKVDGVVINNLETPEKQKLASHNINSATSLPVPLFDIDEYIGNTLCGLSKDFKLYVLDAKPGIFIDEINLQECDCLPKKWKHGYSKGVAMSDERYVIIYWVVVW